ncbi:hypothetical protein NUW58_g4914 [Xylaria curta]|uniref:Uncharacterized protein n=1 Tax=Xylaria curta TaxID=42375 RepID=A0ACC1P4R9_9PEZI|nr:hypothetical protein NUW58_g4914 [Xylaria curta]
MPKPAGLQTVDNEEMNGVHTEHRKGDDGELDAEARAYELRLWPPPYLQAYCVEHFLMECKIYHEQENDRYNKLIAHSRQVFLEKQNRKKPMNYSTPIPTRRQPTRRAKERHSVLMTPPRTPTPTPSEPQRPPRPKKPVNTPLRPPRLETAFMKSQEGGMFRILSKFHRRLELHNRQEDYLAPNTVQDEDATTPRKLAVPAAMHAIKRSGDAKESEVLFRGTNFIVDVCSEKTMIILTGFKGVLDLWAEHFEEEEPMPESPAGLSAHLRNIEWNSKDTSAASAKRPMKELKHDRERKRRKYGVGSGVHGKPGC